MKNVPLPLLYPRYIEKKWIQRTLAYWDETCIVIEPSSDDRPHVFPVSTVDELVTLLFEHNLLLFCRSLASFVTLVSPLMTGDKPMVEILCDEHGHPRALRIKSGHATRWIIEARAWGYSHPSLQMLFDLRETYTHCDVGTVSTPAALGQSLYRKAMKLAYGDDWKHHRHERPPESICVEIKKHSFGARSDLDEEVRGKQFSQLIELDQHNAYGSAACEEPTGKACRFLYGCVEAYTVYFARVTVTIVADLAYGIFPLKHEMPDGSIENWYPTRAGTYETWMWTREVLTCRTAGCLVTIHEGTAWETTTRDSEIWVRFIAWLRDTASTDIMESHLKQAFVAAIGRWGLPTVKYVLTGQRPEEEDVSCLADADGIPFDFWVKEIIDQYPQSMPHWFSFTLMNCRMNLYDQARRYKEQELLIGTNTDAIYITEIIEGEEYPEKGQPTETGAWRKMTHTNIVLPEKRHIESDQVWKTPGIPKKKRKSKREPNIPY